MRETALENLTPVAKALLGEALALGLDVQDPDNTDLSIRAV